MHSEGLAVVKTSALFHQTYSKAWGLGKAGHKQDRACSGSIVTHEGHLQCCILHAGCSGIQLALIVLEGSTKPGSLTQ